MEDQAWKFIHPSIVQYDCTMHHHPRIVNSSDSVYEVSSPHSNVMPSLFPVTIDNTKMCTFTPNESKHQIDIVLTKHENQFKKYRLTVTANQFQFPPAPPFVTQSPVSCISHSHARAATSNIRYNSARFKSKAFRLFAIEPMPPKTGLLLRFSHIVCPILLLLARPPLALIRAYIKYEAFVVHRHHADRFSLSISPIAT